MAAYTVPPLLYICTSRFVVRPLLAWRRRAKEQAEKQEQRSQVGHARL